MSTGGYRDPLTGLRERVRELRATAEGLERRIGWPLWASSDLAQRTRLVELRGLAAQATADDATALHALERVLEESVAILAKVLETADDVQVALDADCEGDPTPGPLHPGDLQPSPLQLDDVGLHAVIAPLLARLAATDPRGTTRMGDDGVLRVRFRRGPVELGLAALMMLDPLYRSRTVCFALGVRVPHIVPTLTVTTSSALGSLGTALGLVVDRTTGDAAFDAAFRVGMPAYAVPLLGPDLRRSLLALRPLARLELQVRSGLARLQWASEVTPASLDGPGDVLLALRAAALGSAEAHR